MYLHEHHAKELLARYGVPVPPGRLASTPQEAADAFVAQGSHPAVVKAQILAGGRGKAGGIVPVQSAAQCRRAAARLLGSRLVTAQTGPDGLPVRSVLIEKSCEAVRQFYLAVLVDRAHRSIQVTASKAGGIDVEAAAKHAPDSLFSERIDSCLGLHPFEARRLAHALQVPQAALHPLTTIAAALARCFIECDCSLVEINPLALTPAGSLVALDAKIILDDNALFRHAEFAAWRDPSQEDPREALAHEHGLSYIGLRGTIGCLVNGAGLAMATMDLLKSFGGEPANFLDVGGNATAERVSAALRLIAQDPHVRVILVNIFGGIVQCHLIAQGILSAAESVRLRVPLVVRLEGTRAEEARRLLARYSLAMTPAESLADAARIAVQLAAQPSENPLR